MCIYIYFHLHNHWPGVVDKDIPTELALSDAYDNIVLLIRGQQLNLQIADVTGFVSALVLNVHMSTT